MLFELFLLLVAFAAKLFQVLCDFFHFAQSVLRQFKALGFLHMLIDSRISLILHIFQYWLRLNSLISHQVFSNRSDISRLFIQLSK